MNTTRKFINSSQIAERWNLKCAANLADYALEKSEVKQHLMKFMFPVQFTIAIAGNLLTLAVLLSGTSNRANRLLTCLAVCDCLMFIMMIADSVITFETFYVIPAVRIFYFEYREYVAFFTNWFAAASVWFVLAISVERLLIIKFPFRSLNSNQVLHFIINRQVVIIGCLIMLMTFCASQAMRFTNFCFWMESCNGTEIRGACQPATTASDMNHVPEYLAAIAPTWLIFNSFVVVIVPVAIVITINISLLRIVKRSNKQELVRSASTARPRRSDEQEKSMTRAIVAIVTCFSMTQGPSGLLYLAINLGLATSWLSEQTQKSLQELTVYTNMLVLTGKMLNFVLFCLTSATFRVRLLNTMTIWCYKLGLVQRPVLNRKYIYASPTGTSTGDKPRASFSRLSTMGEHSREHEDASRTLLTAKSSVASYHWRGRNGQDDSIPMRNGHKKNSASSMGNNNCGARVNNNNTQRSSGSRSSEDSATGNSRPLFMTNHSLEKEQFVESTEM
ncbi:hypothetical protein PRIPAC_80806 [Pristionchus pacificus]|uniref:G protein-coupled receptor n=1 Tax=Pristionchus pacificus TaxID=54126 RepID=A0A2A6CQS5_PRIPA|nr:hypothetical protein PRIPAC_80806 [Pristionchus pacificus]|eukprot:PDM80446.1 G protein-coupled receptor [Pristionchus pacificus]